MDWSCESGFQQAAPVRLLAAVSSNRSIDVMDQLNVCAPNDVVLRKDENCIIRPGRKLTLWDWHCVARGCLQFGHLHYGHRSICLNLLFSEPFAPVKSNTRYFRLLTANASACHYCFRQILPVGLLHHDSRLALRPIIVYYSIRTYWIKSYWRGSIIFQPRGSFTICATYMERFLSVGSVLSFLSCLLLLFPLLLEFNSPVPCCSVFPFPLLILNLTP